MNVHDRFFHGVFSKPEHAAGELRSALPAGLTQRIDWSTLNPIPTKFVDQLLGERCADVLFSVNLEGSGTLAYVLLEHRSTPEALIAFRLLRYEIRIWESYLSAHPRAQSLPLIVPLVVYHDARKWKASRAFSSLLDLDAASRAKFSGFVPRFRFLLDDISTITDEALCARPMTALGRVALFCLAHARRSGDFLAKLDCIRDLLAEILVGPHGVAALAMVISYILEVAEVPPAQLQAFFDGVGPNVEEAFMTGAQILREEGRAEGRAEMLLRLIELKFGSAASVEERVRSAKPEDLDRWAERLLAATTIAEVFGT